LPCAGRARFSRAISVVTRLKPAMFMPQDGMFQTLEQALCSAFWNMNRIAGVYPTDTAT
jgi:hypothetical protein